jgi:flagellar biosynthetic protein FliQ
MTDADLVVDAASSMLWVLLELAAPVVLPVLAAALVVGLLQAATSISESTLSFVPKLVVAIASMAFFGALMTRLLTDFTQAMYDRIPGLLQ